MNHEVAPQVTLVATSSTEAEYVAAARCCAQVLWIQNQLLEYGPKLVLLVLIKAQHHISNESPLLGVNTPRCDEDSLEIMELMVFLTSISIKKSNDVVRLQALIDRKKVIIIEDTIRQALRLDVAAGVDCVPNEEIFAELARIMVRNVDSPSRFLMYPRFLPLLINAQVDDRSSHNTKYTSPALTKKVFANLRRIGKGFLGVDTPLFDETCATLTKQVANLEQDKIAQAMKITKLKQRVRRLEEKRITKPSGLKRLKKDTDEAEPAEVEEMIEVVTAAKLMTEVVTTAATTITAAQMPKASAPRRRRGVVIQDPEETATALVIVNTEVPVVDYQIHHENNKPYYKIIRADGTHKLFLSFITLLKSFDREDLEMLWKLVQERFQSSEPKNFSVDFLLNTLKIMFEKPNVEANI
nr:ribonuclease H-like domain, reverse transcriptase, RNA-dependent DNA polymerase [Tanacetum cinerariifolium]